MRLTSAGAFDATFGAGGAATYVPAGQADALARDVAVDAQGRIVFSGVLNGQAAALAARLLADGTPDGTFDGDGFAWHSTPLLRAGVANAGGASVRSILRTVFREYPACLVTARIEPSCL